MSPSLLRKEFFEPAVSKTMRKALNVWVKNDGLRLTCGSVRLSER